MAGNTYGSGTKREVRPGVWYLRVYAGLDGNGKPRQVHKTFRGTKTQADRALSALTTDVQQKRITGGSETVSQLLDEWYAIRKPQLKHMSQRVIVGRVERVRKALGSKRVSRLTVRDIDRFYASCQAEGLAPKTIEGYHAVLHGALKQAQRWGWRPDNPADLATKPSPQEQEMAVPTPDELRDLIVEADLYNPLLASVIALAALTGARRGELAQLRWSDVDLNGATVTIRGTVIYVAGEPIFGTTKTGKTRRVALDEMALAVLERTSAMQQRLAVDCGCPMVEDPFVFSEDPDGGSPVNPNMLTRGMHKITKGRFRFHDLRHFSATQLIAAGVDVRTVSERLGHSTATQTLDRYAHALPERDREAAGVIGSKVQLPALPAARS